MLFDFHFFFEDTYLWNSLKVGMSFDCCLRLCYHVLNTRHVGLICKRGISIPATVRPGCFVFIKAYLGSSGSGLWLCDDCDLCEMLLCYFTSNASVQRYKFLEVTCGI